MDSFIFFNTEIWAVSIVTRQADFSAKNYDLIIYGDVFTREKC